MTGAHARSALRNHHAGRFAIQDQFPICAELRRRFETSCIVQIVGEGAVPRAGNMSASSVECFTDAREAGRPARIDEERIGMVEMLSTKATSTCMPRVGVSGEGRRRKFGHLGRQGIPFLLPLLQAAVENCHGLVAEPAHQPPQP